MFVVDKFIVVGQSIGSFSPDWAGQCTVLILKSSYGRVPSSNSDHCVDTHLNQPLGTSSLGSLVSDRTCIRLSVLSRLISS